MSSIPVAAPPARRVTRAVLAAASLAAAAILLGNVRLGGLPIPQDYYQYWSAGWLVARGENPYDPARMLEVQAAGGMTLPTPVMSWHPPWTLAVALPFGQLSLPTGLLAWSAVQTAAVFAAAELLWWAFGGPVRWRWVAWAVAAGFAPTLYLLKSGQITGLCLLGVAGFLAATRAGRPGWAGVALALTAIKPHMLALFGLAVLLDATRTRATRVTVAVGVTVLLAASLVVFWLDPAILTQYTATVADRDGTNPYRVTDVLSPALAWHLRQAVAPGSFTVQLLPLAAGAVVVVAVWLARGRTWDWRRDAPWLVLGSVLVPPYGSWVYDLVLLVVPVLAAAVWLADPGVPVSARAVGAASLAAVSVGLYAMVNLATQSSDIWVEWVTPAVLAGVLLAGVMTRRPAVGGVP